MSRTIAVKGVGKCSFAHDTIRIFAEIERRDREYEKALKLAAHAVELLKSAVKRRGFAENDLKTSSFNVNAEYESVRDPDGSYKNEFAGYCVRYDMQLSFECDTEKLRGVLAAAAKSGAEARLNISFELAAKEAAVDAALALAAEDAKRKAASIAKAMDVRLLKVLNIEQSGVSHSFVSRTEFREDAVAAKMMNARSAIAGIAPHDIETEESVTAVWEIE